jgi:hypothetical protein
MSRAMGAKRYACKILIEKLEGMKQLRIPRYISENNIKIDLNKI